ncbi:cytochrome P450 monooxygenase [Massarina eburnea CBS 473.64]|uniref:Cytochrome P450 monooxygenase n=1 Tax=Massarina eburnea CBS 473.64 TaxID=1395130 RepID=A0A6A6RW93_9PLEO|nr:cytochrome P450 monooxygenase [Massarina eburnea CBS 473.64]
MISPTILALIGAPLIYTIIAIFQRLFLSPVSSFPGPKIAAATYWYEFYYDIILGGKYIWKLQELHERYGPIIRINPHELHVMDASFWEVMYTASTNNNRRDKWSWQTDGLGIPESILAAAPHALHRHRRSAINPFFSKQNVRKLLPVIEERVDALVRQLKICGDRREVVSIEHAFSAFTNDVVMQYCFGRCDRHIEAPDFDPLYHNTSMNAGKSIAVLKHMNWILTTMKLLPESMAIYMGEEVSSNIRLKRERITQVEAIRSEDSDKVAERTKTIFHTLLQSDLPDREKETSRLAEEAVLLVGAGTHTSSWCLTVIAFHLLSNETLLRQLKNELRTVAPGPDGKPGLSELESLPFLTAVLKEGLRLGYGATVRSARIAPDTSLRCGNFTIPPGTPVSMTIPLTHHDESIFKDSNTFNPDRWLSPDSHHLEKYLVSFSKGSRSCAGINLAWAELYLCASGIFGKYGSKNVRDDVDVGIMELFETTEGDVKLVSDMFFPIPKEGSKGVRVKVTTL